MNKDCKINPVERSYMANTDFRNRLKERPKDKKEPKDKDENKGEFVKLLQKKYEEKEKRDSGR